MSVFSKASPDSADHEGFELQFAYQAREILQMLAGRLPLRDEIEALAQEKGVAFASHVLHRSILAAQPHSAFIRHVQSIRPRPQARDVNRAPIEVVFVPSTQPGLRLRWGAHTTWMRVVARELGFTTDVIETSPRESITGNARVIGDYLQAARAERIILVTMGRGSAEARLLLQRRGRSSKDLHKVRGWINIGGAFGGSRGLSLLLSDRFARAEARAACWMKRAKFTALQELSDETGIWRERLSVHDHLMIVSVFGLLTPDRVPVALRANYDRLSAYGPNDGGVLAYEAMARPGLLYPVMGLSHLGEELVLGPVLQRLLTSMSASIAQGDRLSAEAPRPVYAP
ncbi:MAG: hypothetical protein NDI61_09580 [Bdellovibrionaceae bacterium]|nr:hypothetical protein [Pseudobdellovibrionaceae bacterium]